MNDTVVCEQLQCVYNVDTHCILDKITIKPYSPPSEMWANFSICDNFFVGFGEEEE